MGGCNAGPGECCAIGTASRQRHRLSAAFQGVAGGALRTPTSDVGVSVDSRSRRRSSVASAVSARGIAWGSSGRSWGRPGRLVDQSCSGTVLTSVSRVASSAFAASSSSPPPVAFLRVPLRPLCRPRRPPSCARRRPVSLVLAIHSARSVLLFLGSSRSSPAAPCSCHGRPSMPPPPASPCVVVVLPRPPTSSGVRRRPPGVRQASADVHCDRVPMHVMTSWICRPNPTRPKFRAIFSFSSDADDGGGRRRPTTLADDGGRQRPTTAADDGGGGQRRRTTTTTTADDDDNGGRRRTTTADGGGRQRRPTTADDNGRRRRPTTAADNDGGRRRRGGERRRRTVTGDRPERRPTTDAVGFVERKTRRRGRSQQPPKAKAEADRTAGRPWTRTPPYRLV